jgi:hypothetical protein
MDTPCCLNPYPRLICSLGFFIFYFCVIIYIPMAVVIKKCNFCGKEMSTTTTHINRGRGRHCSKRCSFDSKKGKPSWNKGMTLPSPSDETRAKLQKYHKEHPIRYWLNKKFPSHVCSKMSNSHKGKPTWNKGVEGCFSESSIEKMSRIKIGKKLPAHVIEFLRHRKMSPENIIKARERNSGSKSRFWRGGIAYTPYSKEFSPLLKRQIRERDGNICFVCHVSGKSENHSCNLSVHHIDYDKHNCSLSNLVSLCKSCHTKTTNSREFWTEWFKLNPRPTYPQF